MSVTLKVVAQAAQDLYLQDYASNDTFFELSDFMFHCATAYSSMLDAGFQASRKMSKQEGGYSVPEISASWLVKDDKIKIEKLPNGDYVGTTSFPIFNFTYDAFGYGVQYIKSDKCKNMAKVSNDEWNSLDLVPVTGFIFYKMIGKNQILFSSNPGNVFGEYVPAVVGNDDNCVMSEAIVPDVIKSTLTLMFGARNGTTIDMTDNQNRNATPQTEIDKNTTA